MAETGYPDTAQRVIPPMNTVLFQAGTRHLGGFLMCLQPRRRIASLPSLCLAFMLAHALCLPLSALPTPEAGLESPVLVVTDDRRVLDAVDAVSVAGVPGALGLMPLQPPSGPMPSPSGGSSHGKDKLIPYALVGAGLAAIAFDGSFKNSGATEAERKRDAFTETINKLGSTPVLLATVGSLYLLDDKDTGKLALAALLNAGVITEVTKRLTGRARPYVPGDAGDFTGPKSDGSYKSFPSGHASATFALATVLADRHPKQKWLYYGLASAVSLARIYKSAHFPSDVLVGAGVGIYSGKHVLDHGAGLFTIKF